MKEKTQSISIISAIVIVAITFALRLCNHSNYEPEKTQQMLDAVNKERILADIPRTNWQLLYKQYVTINKELTEKADTLINTPWSDQKAQDLNDLLSSEMYSQWTSLGHLMQSLTLEGFEPRKFFTDEQLAEIQELTATTKEKIAILKAQADID